MTKQLRRNLKSCPGVKATEHLLLVRTLWLLPVTLYIHTFVTSCYTIRTHFGHFLLREELMRHNMILERVYVVLLLIDRQSVQSLQSRQCIDLTEDKRMLVIRCTYLYYIHTVGDMYSQSHQPQLHSLYILTDSLDIRLFLISLN